MSVSRVHLLFLCATTVLSVAPGAKAQELVVTNRAGVHLQVDQENTEPSLKILLPGQPASDPGIEVLFPEHVTARPHGAEAQHLYLFRPGRQEQRPLWRLNGMSLEYQMPLAGILLTARATLEEDGVRYNYEFSSSSGPAYDLIQAVTDPRMATELLRDIRLERTYVHHANGFDLLASETPARLTMPLREWLPNRFRVPFSWPVDTSRVEKQPDGITWYNKSRPVDGDVRAGSRQRMDKSGIDLPACGPPDIFAGGKPCRAGIQEPVVPRHVSRRAEKSSEPAAPDEITPIP